MEWTRNLILTQSLFRLADALLLQNLDSATALGSDGPQHLTLGRDDFDDSTQALSNSLSSTVTMSSFNTCHVS